MKKSAFISDLLFAFFALFLPTLCLFRYWRIHLVLSLFLASLCGLCAAVPTFFFLRGKCEKNRAAAKGLAEREQLLFRLTLCDDGELRRLFEKYSKAEAADGEKEGETEEERENFFLFTFDPITPDSLLPVLKAKTEKPKRLYCNELSPEAEKLCARFGIRTIAAEGVYRLLKDADDVPVPPEEEPKKRLKDKPKKWFSKRNSKRFLTGGVLVLVASLASPFPKYYLIFGLALILSAVFIRVFGYR